MLTHPICWSVLSCSRQSYSLGFLLLCPRAMTRACTNHHNPKSPWTNTRYFSPNQVSDTLPDGPRGNLVLCVFSFQNKACHQKTEQMCQHPVPKTKIHKLPGTTSPLVNVPYKECCYYSTSPRLYLLSSYTSNTTQHP